MASEFLMDLRKQHSYIDKAESLMAQSLSYMDNDSEYSIKLANQSIAMSLIEIARQLEEMNHNAVIRTKTR